MSEPRWSCVWPWLWSAFIALVAWVGLSFLIALAVQGCGDSRKGQRFSVRQPAFTHLQAQIFLEDSWYVPNARQRGRPRLDPKELTWFKEAWILHYGWSLRSRPSPSPAFRRRPLTVKILGRGVQFTTDPGGHAGGGVGKLGWVDRDSHTITLVAGERLELPDALHQMHHLMYSMDFPRVDDPYHQVGPWGQVVLLSDILAQDFATPVLEAAPWVRPA